MEVFDLGKVEYQKALELQEQHLESVFAKRESSSGLGHLLVCEHPTVITVGRGLNSKSEVLTDKILPIEVSRGGRATLHNEGQIVAYPIVDLKKLNIDLHSYLRILEGGIISTLNEFGITGFRVEGKTGVWVKLNDSPKKIASLGVAVRKWVTYHGVALNVSNDISEFQMLNPCGMGYDVMTNMRQLLKTLPSLELVKGTLVKNLIEALEKRNDI